MQKLSDAASELVFILNDKDWPNYTTAEYMKVCSLEEASLKIWVSRDGKE